MLGPMRFAVVHGIGVAAAVACIGCGSTELQPIRDPPGVDAAGRPSDMGDASAVEAAPADAGALACKRGVASNAGPSAMFAASASRPGLSWWYNWASRSPGGDPRIEFVPMLWGGGSLNEALPQGARYVLGFNEPNFKKQANLTAQQAAADWPKVEAMAAGVPVVSPGVNFCGSASNAALCSDPSVTDPYTYLQDFFAACAGCKVDYIAVHAYDCDLPSLRSYLEGNVDAGGSLQGFVQFGKPLWVTEFSCDASHSVSEQKAFMQAAVPYLEGNAAVFRYAWFNAKEIPSGALTATDGSLTDLGTTYVGLPAACAAPAP